MGEIQTGLYAKLQEVSSSKKLTKSRLTVDVPVISDYNIKKDMKEMINTLYYEPSGIFHPAWIDDRAPRVSYITLFKNQYIKQKTVTLQRRCTRIAIIDGNIWAPIPSANIIQRFAVDGTELPPIEFTNCGPRSVKQLSDGNIILASDAGLYTLDEDFAIDEKIEGIDNGTSDVAVKDNRMIAMNYSQNKAVYFECTADTWVQTGVVPQKHGQYIEEATVVFKNGIFITTKKGGYHFLSRYNNEHKIIADHTTSPILPDGKLYVIGTDPQDNIIVADYKRKTFQVFYAKSSNWHLLNNTFLPDDIYPMDLLCDQQGNLWVLAGQQNTTLTKYSKVQAGFRFPDSVQIPDSFNFKSVYAKTE